MIYLKLFINFLIIGTLSFGGGYGMISLMREIVLSNHWLSEDMFMSFVAVAESTPGPLAVNLATFVGSSQGGFPGAFFATLGVVLPAFIILLLMLIRLFFHLRIVRISLIFLRNIFVFFLIFHLLLFSFLQSPHL